MAKTLNAALSDAEICRRNGWRPGTLIRGTEHFQSGKSQTNTIKITAVGEESILARCVDGDGDPEHSWTLKCREWKKVSG